MLHGPTHTPDPDPDPTLTLTLTLTVVSEERRRCCEASFCSSTVDSGT